jgi:hypothetical protein
LIGKKDNFKKNYKSLVRLLKKNFVLAI